MDQISSGEFNEAGGVAYKLSPEIGLAQYALTGCLSNTFYADAEMQLSKALSMAKRSGLEFVAKVAVYAREKGYMKEMPALLCVYLATQSEPGLDLLSRIFPRVIDNGKMLRHFVRILRSGVTGRKSLGTRLKKLIAAWFNSRTSAEIFYQSIGNNPSFRDIILLSHPRPLEKSKNALYRWLMGLSYEHEDLPLLVQQYEDFKTGKNKEVPSVPFEMLTALELGQSEWCQIAMKANWHWLRMNLNTMFRHKVFEIPEMESMVAQRLADEETVQRARAFPYQLLATYKNVSPGIPRSLKDAIQDAMEFAIANVPTLAGTGYICVDISGSMANPVTGHRNGSTTKVRCVDVAGLLASTILRKNPSAAVIPFNQDVRSCDFNPRDTVLTNADKIGRMVGGGTNCSAPLTHLNSEKAKGDWVWIISDNESWCDTMGVSRWGSRVDAPTRLQEEWGRFRSRNPQAKLVSLDIQPYSTTQIQDRSDILNVGGFSDAVFDVTTAFLRDELTPDHWRGVIDSVKI